MINRKALILYFLIIIIFQNISFGRVHNYETARLKSTAGTGVGSVLTSESAILNPAPLAFFNFSTVYAEKSSMKMSGSNENSLPDETYSEMSDTMNFIVADTNSGVKGALGYLKQKEGKDERKRISAALAQPISKSSSFGLIYRYTVDQNFDFNSAEAVESKYNQLVLGTTHIIEPNFTMGIIVVDPLKNNPGDTKAIFGFQYVMKDILTLMFDMGADYSNGEISETLLYRGAAQVNFFADLYFRAGTFVDKGILEKGNGFGVGWIGPKLIFDIAFKSSKPMSSSALLLSGNEKVRETSLALTYKF